MDKAILVIDMPECCDDCKLCYYSDGRVPICYWEGKVVDGIKPNWCPLRALPKKKIGFHYANEYDYCAGYNACIDEILGKSLGGDKYD